MKHAGIDEAGYGPTLGPLAITCAVAEAASPELLASALQATGVRDSKDLHDPKSLAPLERVALPAVAWLTGFQPDTAADLFALLGESPEQRRDIPWMAGAETLRLPVAAGDVPTWEVPEVTPRGLHGSLVHPRAYNDFLRARGNKADLEWSHVGKLLATCHDPQQEMRTVVDRLGGRKFYRDVLQTVFSDTLVLVEEERNDVSRYRLPAASHAGHGIGFYVGGESVSPLTAVASCVAKYARELHMLLLNRYWCGRLTWLKPTAGYPQDATRWLHQVGEGYVSAWREELVRGLPST
jgi:ribonuclease HII